MLPVSSVVILIQIGICPAEFWFHWGYKSNYVMRIFNCCCFVLVLYTHAYISLHTDMVAVKSKKPLLSTRVSWEVYDRVVALTKGEKPQFESISDYLTATILTDLARRDMGIDAEKAKMLAMLQDPEIQKELCRRLG
ncbi:hypothetical protein Mlab_1604 [Methanocorpusculum labreanum Z]|uniref:Uncharacterized protein n=2 Tax=root TaxID=1 RepID=A2STW0_METLZ|nr:hypothetical protein Mlab_1604 [Methanocorpusculum labreanum Z]